MKLGIYLDPENDTIHVISESEAKKKKFQYVGTASNSMLKRIKEDGVIKLDGKSIAKITGIALNVKPNVDYVGFKYGDPKKAIGKDQNKTYGISADERVHMAIFGLPGSGKSSILKLLAWQNIVRNEGFMVIDPHGSLARDIMSMIPKERYDDVIYVNPATLYKFGKTIQVNPLEVKSDNERYVVVMSFVSALYNLYKDSWGPRLETVLRNAANALVESPGNNRLGNISAMITDETERNIILNTISSRNVVHFWQEIFAKQYSKDAGSAAYNKMDKILATPTVAAMFDCIKSSISIRDIMENNRMLIVDLSTGASDDIAEFLGSILLNMLYVDAKKRLDIAGEESSVGRFYVYVDEAHMFSNSTMSEMLRSLRKFGVKMTLATQTCNAYDKEFAQEIPGICKTIITGRCDFNTAGLLRAIMAISSEEMQRLPSHTFALFSDEKGVHANAIFRSRPVPLPRTIIESWEKVVAASIKRWGKQVSIEKYSIHDGPGRPLFTPLECSIIHMMYFDNRDWYREEILQKCNVIFPQIIERQTSTALDRLTRERYIKIRYPQTDDGDENDHKNRYVLDEKSYSTYLSTSYGGQRAGGEDHMEIILRLARMNMINHRYCIPDLGDRGNDAADLLIIEPNIIRDKTGGARYDPNKWSDKKILAVEVEMDPTKHMSHSVENYTKNFERGYDVWFICINENHRAKLEEAIRIKHPEFKGCKMDVINLKNALSDNPKLPDTYNESFSDVKVKSIITINRIVGNSWILGPSEKPVITIDGDAVYPPENTQRAKKQQLMPSSEPTFLPMSEKARKSLSTIKQDQTIPPVEKSTVSPVNEPIKPVKDKTQTKCEKKPKKKPINLGKQTQKDSPENGAYVTTTGENYKGGGFNYLVEMPNGADIPHLNSLEQEIYDRIKAGKIYRYNAAMIHKLIQMNQSLEDTKRATSNLIKKKIIKKNTAIYRRSRMAKDGTTKLTNMKTTVLEPISKQEWEILKSNYKK